MRGFLKINTADVYTWFYQKNATNKLTPRDDRKRRFSFRIPEKSDQKLKESLQGMDYELDD